LDDPNPNNNKNSTTQYAHCLNSKPSTTVKVQKQHMDDMLQELFIEQWARWELSWELVTILRDGFPSPNWSISPNSSMIHIAAKVLFRLTKQSTGGTYC
jgi:hypothetical protein